MRAPTGRPRRQVAQRRCERSVVRTAEQAVSIGPTFLAFKPMAHSAPCPQPVQDAHSVERCQGHPARYEPFRV